MSIEVKDLCFAYGEHEVLHGVSFKAEAGEFLSILGPNGVGKSTLFRCVLGLLRDYKGSITVEGRDAKSLSIRETAKLIAYIPQSSHPAFNYSVRDPTSRTAASTASPAASASSRSSPGPWCSARRCSC